MVKDRFTIRLTPLKGDDVRELVTRILYSKKELVVPTLLLLEYLKRNSGYVKLHGSELRNLLMTLGTSERNFMYIIRKLHSCGLVDVRYHGKKEIELKLSTRFIEMLKKYIDIWYKFISS